MKTSEFFTINSEARELRRKNRMQIARIQGRSKNMSECSEGNRENVGKVFVHQ